MQQPNVCGRSCWFGRCLAEGLRIGDQRRQMGLLGSGKNLFLIYFHTQYILVSGDVVLKDTGPFIVSLFFHLYAKLNIVL